MEKGYEFDAVVIDDSNLSDTEMSLYERLERLIYMAEESRIIRKYVRGQQVI